jgi:hypothetical protein
MMMHSLIPGYDHLYLLEDPVSNVFFRADFALNELDALPSGLYEMFSKSGYNLHPPPDSPPRLYHGMGRAQPSDIVWPMAAMPPFISDRVIGLLTDHNVTGWSSFPVEIIDRHGTLHRTHHRLMITATPCGPIDWLRGELIERTEVPRGRYYRGGWFDPATWDGSDLFYSQNWGFPLVVERVRNLFVRAKIKNIEFVRFTDYEMPESLAIR